MSIKVPVPVPDEPKPPASPAAPPPYLKPGEPTDRMFKWFAYEHLPPHLQAISKPFANLATLVCVTIDAGPERTVALRKLLEAKDAAVRAALFPGA